MSSLVLLLALLCVIICSAVHSDQVEESSVLNLPKKSSEFFALFSSKGPDETLELLQIDKGDAFNRWVLWSIHGANKSHWYIKDKSSYARVLDLLNWTRQQGLMPIPIDINKICHKGMEQLQKVDNDDISIPPKPNEHIPTALWADLWISCHKKLSSRIRTASNCIDLPGVVVRSSNPNKSNNPCDKEYRMVDGAHRICLRKYGLALLKGDIAELQSLLLDVTSLDHKKDIIDQITDKENMIAKVSHAMFLEMDQDMASIYSGDPIRHHKAIHLSQELKDEWKVWMRRVLAFVHDWRDHYPKTEIANDIENKQNEEL